MIMMMVPLAALLIGVLCGGRPDALVRLPLRWLWLVPVAFAVQWVVIRIPTMDPHPALGLVLVASYAAILTFLLINRRLPGLAIAAIGTLLNLTAMVANGGFMPTTQATLAAAGLERTHMVLGQRVLASKDILLPPGGGLFGGLGDTLVLVWPIPQAISIGDILVAVGIGALVFFGTQPRWGWMSKPGNTGGMPHPSGQGFAAEAQPTHDPGRPT
jgi:hypothetical protein